MLNLIKKAILIFVLLYVAPNLFSATVDFFYWNVDGSEAAFAGAVTAKRSLSYGENMNPASLSIFSKDKAGEGMWAIAFPHALRMVSLFIEESYYNVYDLVDSSDKWDDTKYHSKWMLFSLLGIYRLHWSNNKFAIALLPFRDVPTNPEYSLTRSSIAFSFKIGSLLQAGLDLGYYYKRGSYYHPFSFVDRDLPSEDGLGFSGGFLFSLNKKLTMGVDYRYSPDFVFEQVKDVAYPFKKGLSLGLNWSFSPHLEFSFDIVNLVDPARADFFAPRLSGQWAFLQSKDGNANLLWGYFQGLSNDHYLTLGFSFSGILDKTPYSFTIATIFDVLEQKHNSFVFSCDFFITD